MSPTSAQIAVHVHVSPAPSGAALALATFFLLGVGEAPDFVHVDFFALQITEGFVLIGTETRARIV